jgi:hypothetical protein
MDMVLPVRAIKNCGRDERHEETSEDVKPEECQLPRDLAQGRGWLGWHGPDKKSKYAIIATLSVEVQMGGSLMVRVIRVIEVRPRAWVDASRS